MMQWPGYLSTIIADMGEIFRLVAPVSCLPPLIAVLFREWGMLVPMATVPALFFVLGYALRRLPRDEWMARLSTALCSVALFLLAGAVVSGVPFMLGLHMEFSNAFFESMAGWTGTAFSMIRDSSSIPHTLQFCRSYLQWISGVGIIAFSIAMAASSGLLPAKLLRTEGREEPLMPAILATGRSIASIYGFLTFCAIGLIMFAGLPLWDSVNLALTAVSTGGFTLHEGGIAYYDNALLEMILIPVMIAGALPFRLYYLIAGKRKLGLFGDEQLKILAFFFIAGAAVIAYDLVFFNDLDPATALRQGLFMSASALSTTGFQTVDLQAWTGVTLLVLAMLVFSGGATGSTAGGIKLQRVARWPAARCNDGSAACLSAGVPSSRSGSTAVSSRRRRPSSRRPGTCLSSSSPSSQSSPQRLSSCRSAWRTAR